MPQPLIYHIDSAFFSWEAAELLRQDPDAPDIRSFPSVIGGSEKTRHGIVLAKSPSAAALGVSGSASRHWQGSSPDLKSGPRTTASMWSVPASSWHFSKNMRPRWTLSLTSTRPFYDMTGTSSLYGIRWTCPQAGRGDSHPARLTVNIGISSNRLLAKTASDFEKTGQSTRFSIRNGRKVLAASDRGSVFRREIHRPKAPLPRHHNHRPAGQKRSRHDSLRL